MSEFYEPRMRKNHVNIDTLLQGKNREKFHRRYLAAKFSLKAQCVVKRYILDNNIKFEAAK